MGIIRILFIADSHLGFDLPFRPRVVRQRRGSDFFNNFERALLPALNGSVDCVVHGGDLFYRSKVPARLVTMAFEPLKRVADKGDRYSSWFYGNTGRAYPSFSGINKRFGRETHCSTGILSRVY
ncbi:MAG: metallophosphoesterase [Deltaproteobacteria bacterium]|nr:metallophosphoesterase [Deltaproteobacteria bacterium]